MRRNSPQDAGARVRSSRRLIIDRTSQRSHLHSHFDILRTAMTFILLPILFADPHFYKSKTKPDCVFCVTFSRSYSYFNFLIEFLSFILRALVYYTSSAYRFDNVESLRTFLHDRLFFTRLSYNCRVQSVEPAATRSKLRCSSRHTLTGRQLFKGESCVISTPRIHLSRIRTRLHSTHSTHSTHWETRPSSLSSD